VTGVPQPRERGGDPGECPRICVGMSEVELHVYEDHSPEQR
jgi:hypothetical protein